MDQLSQDRSIFGHKPVGGAAVRATRFGDFSPKNAKNLGYFPPSLQTFWAIFRQIAEILAVKTQNSDFGIF